MTPRRFVPPAPLARVTLRSPDQKNERTVSRWVWRITPGRSWEVLSYRNVGGGIADS